MKQKHFIDSHKAATSLWVLALMTAYGQWDNPTLWLYLALHGGYGILWLLKSRIFPDPQWEKPTNLGLGIGIWAALSLYWVAPWIIASRGVVAPTWWMGVCAAIWGFGVFFHFVSDMQKHATLAVRRGLITDGMFARSRNPNYFGELLIYFGFSALALHWLPLAALLFFVVAVWVPNMRKKDRSLSRYPEFEAYRARTAMFVPYVA